MPTSASFFMPITKVEKTPEGHRMVYGQVSTERVDLDGQIADYAWAKKEAQDWFGIANVREQHSRNVVGKGLELGLDDKAKSVSLTSKVVDPVAITKLDEGLFTGYSFGAKNVPGNPIKVVKDAAAPGGRIVGGKWIEISLADRPANPDAVLSLAKAVDSTIEIDKVVGEFTEAELTKLAEALEKATTADDWKAVEADVYKRQYSDSERAALAKKGQAIPVKNDQGEIVSGRYPIADAQDLGNAVKAIGRAKEGDEAKVKAFIKRRAAALGKSDVIPDDWKNIDPDLAKDLTGDEAFHNDALLSARNAIRQLIQQEAGEAEPGMTYQIGYLVDSLQSLDCFESSEMFEEQYASYGKMATDLAAVSDKETRRSLYKSVSEALKKAANEHKPAVAPAPAELTLEPASPPPATADKVVEPDSEKFLTAESIKAVLPDHIKAMLPELLKEHKEVLKETLGETFASKSVEEKVEQLGKRAQPIGPAITDSVGLRQVDKTHAVNDVLEQGDVPAEVLGELAKYAEMTKSEDVTVAQSARRMLVKLKTKHGLAE